MFLFLCGPRQFCRVPCATWYLLKELLSRPHGPALLCLPALRRFGFFLFCVPSRIALSGFVSRSNGVQRYGLFFLLQIYFEFFSVPLFPLSSFPLFSVPRIPCACGVQRCTSFSLPSSIPRSFFKVYLRDRVTGWLSGRKNIKKCKESGRDISFKPRKWI